MTCKHDFPKMHLLRRSALVCQGIAKKLKLDGENALVKKLEERARLYEERMKIPFYMTLRAQKEERDKFIDFYQTGAMFGTPAIEPEDGQQSEIEPKYIEDAGEA